MADSSPVSAAGLRTFRRLAVAACAATYFLIWVGGLVRVSGAGLGCPDWPKCFGRWVPPTDLSQVPPELASQFNVTLAWIEYLNRLVGVTIGFLILALAVVAVARLRQQRFLVWGSIVATALVALQGYQGSVVVSSLLEPWVITAHFVLAILIISLLVSIAVHAWRLENPGDGKGARYPRGVRGFLALAWALALSQVGLGTWLRGAIETQLDERPLRTDAELIAGLGWPGHIHLAMGFLVALLVGWLCIRFLRDSEDPSWLVRFGSLTSLGLVGLQVLVGLGFVAFGVPPTVQLFHSWLSTLLIGAMLVLWSGARRTQGALV